MAFQLFEDDSDEDEDSEAEEEIIVKPQFQGKEGEKVGCFYLKILKLRTRIYVFLTVTPLIIANSFTINH